MSYEYAVDTRQRLVRVRMWGPITRPEIMAVVKEMVGDARIGPDFGQLIDVRDVSTATLSNDDLRQIAGSDLDPVARRAFVVSEDATYGLARMFGSLREGRGAPERIAVFTNIYDADAWLGVSGSR